MGICSVGAELFHADRKTDRHGEANSRFSQFCECAQNGIISNIMEVMVKANLITI